ncbi:transposase [Sorangium sp. So ce1128]
MLGSTCTCDASREGAHSSADASAAAGDAWVMSLPFELRALAAKRSDVLAVMERIFAEEIARLTTQLAGIAGARTGSVGFPQRFGSSLNVHVHFHTLAIDGVFEKTAFGVRFHDAPPPSKDDLGEVA